VTASPRSGDSARRTVTRSFQTNRAFRSAPKQVLHARSGLATTRSFGAGVGLRSPRCQRSIGRSARIGRPWLSGFFGSRVPPGGAARACGSPRTRTRPPVALSGGPHPTPAASRLGPGQSRVTIRAMSTRTHNDEPPSDPECTARAAAPPFAARAGRSRAAPGGPIPNSAIRDVQVPGARTSDWTPAPTAERTDRSEPSRCGDPPTLHRTRDEHPSPRPGPRRDAGAARCETEQTGAPLRGSGANVWNTCATPPKRVSPGISRKVVPRSFRRTWPSRGSPAPPRGMDSAESHRTQIAATTCQQSSGRGEEPSGPRRDYPVWGPLQVTIESDPEEKLWDSESTPTSSR
jgi:hypothetical protein